MLGRLSGFTYHPDAPKLAPTRTMLFDVLA